MTGSQSAFFCLFLGLPVLGILVLGVFRVDWILAGPHRRSTLGHPLSHRDESGQVVCIEPDGRYLCRSGFSSVKAPSRRRAGDLPRRCSHPVSPKVAPEWQWDDQK